MMLTALGDYYRRLEQDGKSDVAPFGYSKQKISFSVVIDPDGALVGFHPEVIQQGKKEVPRLMIVPGGAKSTGQGFDPCFLWDNTAYLLGYSADETKAARAPKCFEKFRERHCALEAEIDDPEFSAVCRFLKSWAPARAADYPDLAKLLPGFGVFQLRAAMHFVHDRPNVDAWWRRQLAAEDACEQVSGQCLVTGKLGPLAKLHEPAIKGVLGSQTAGAKIVSFNADAFESYGKSQSFNAPVTERAAFAYCTALNVLLERDSAQKVQLGDTTLSFWTAKPTPFEGLFGRMMNLHAVEDEDQKKKVLASLEAIRAGKKPPELGPPDTPFFVLGLSPNASRLSVRFWLRSTVGEAEANLGVHFRDLQLEHGPNDSDYPSAYQLLRETAREAKDIPPLLEGSLLRAIGEGLPYPEALYSAVLRRMKADQRISYLRVAILKATLQRKARLRIGFDYLTKEIAVTLDVERTEPAYHLGRLFAILEKAQEQALPGINDTIKDRFFGAASATPGSVFPRLVRLNQHHLGKLDKGPKIYFERLNQSVVGKLDCFPAHLSLRDQGLFAIGYYHQRQDLFTKKNDNAANDMNDQPSNDKE